MPALPASNKLRLRKQESRRLRSSNTRRFPVKKKPATENSAGFRKRMESGLK